MAVKNTLAFIAFVVAFASLVLINNAGWDEHKRAIHNYANANNIDLTQVRGLQCINAKLHYEVKLSVIPYEPKVSCTAHEINAINHAGKNATDASGMLIMILFLLFVYWGIRAIGNALLEREPNTGR